MKKGKTIIITILVLGIVLGVVPLCAQARVPDRGDWAIGVDLSLPAIGLSGKYWLTDKIGLQATLGPFGEVNSYGGKVLYRLTKGENYYLYGGLSAGSLTLRNTYSGYGGYEYEYENSISGIGLIGGVEWIGKHLAFSLEAGYGIFNLEASMNGVPVDLPEEYQSVGAPIFGLGLTWYFR